jgi:hypothetical protein
MQQLSAVAAVAGLLLFFGPTVGHPAPTPDDDVSGIVAACHELSCSFPAKMLADFPPDLSMLIQDQTKTIYGSLSATAYQANLGPISMYGANPTAFSTIQAGQFLINDSSEANKNSYGITIGNIGTSPATAALFIGAGTSAFNDGISINNSRVLSNAINIFDQIGSEKTTLFQLGYSALGGTLALTTVANISIGTTSPGALLEETKLLIRQNGADLLIGDVNGSRVSGAFYIKTSTNNDSEQTPIEFSTNKMFFPSTSIIAGSTVDHMGEMLQVTGRSWFNGDVGITGTFALKKDDLSASNSGCYVDDGWMTVKAFGDDLYACSNGYWRRMLFDKMPGH